MTVRTSPEAEGPLNARLHIAVYPASDPGQPLGEGNITLLEALNLLKALTTNSRLPSFTVITDDRVVLTILGFAPVPGVAEGRSSDPSERHIYTITSVSGAPEDAFSIIKLVSHMFDDLLVMRPAPTPPPWSPDATRAGS